MSENQIPQRATSLSSRLSRMRRLFPKRSVLMLYLAAIGPGIFATLAGNDAGGIGTYSLTGAQFGYKMLWLLFIITFVLAIVQEMAARMGAVTQKGLGELIREQYGVSWTLFALGVMFVANSATTVANFAGIAAAGELFGISRYLSVPLSALMMWLLVTRGPFRLVERIFLAICLVQLTYVFAAFKAVSQLPEGQGWSHIMTQLVTPQIERSPAFILLAISTVGTTVAPWMQFFLQSSIVDKGVHVGEYRYQKADVYAGVIVADIIAFFIIVCTAATLHHSHVSIHDATDAARALSIPLGHLGLVLFAAGLLSASLLASVALPLVTAYTYCEAFGWEIGLQRSVKEAPVFYGLFTATQVIGAVVVLIPNVPLFSAMLISQFVNGVLLPVVLVFMLGLVNNRRIMGDWANNKTQNIVTWTTVVVLIALTGILLISTIFPKLLTP